MSESHKHSGEHFKSTEHATHNYETHKTHEKQETTKETAEQNKAHVEELRNKVKELGVSGKESSAGEHKADNSSNHYYADQKQLKANAYQKSMRQIRSKLSKPDRTLSKVIHNKTVENISEVSGKTVARPSGLLGGGICALTGSVFLLYMSKHYGFQYNYALFFMLFVGGFFIGMLGELLLRYVFHKTPN